MALPSRASVINCGKMKLVAYKSHSVLLSTKVELLLHESEDQGPRGKPLQRGLPIKEPVWSLLTTDASMVGWGAHYQ